MKRGKVILLIINIVLIITMLFNAIFHILNSYILPLFLFVFLFFLLKYFGFEKNSKSYIKDILYSILIVCFTYTILSYLSGLLLGFLKSPLSMNILKILIRILPVILLIIVSELIRYILITKGKKYRSILMLTTITFILIDISLLTGNYNFNTNSKILEFILLIIVSISKNIFLSYASYMTDYKIPIIYRLYIELPILILPIFPNLGDYVNTMVSFLMPIIFIYIIYVSLLKEKIRYQNTKEQSTIKKYISNAIFIIIIILFIGINSGWFKYYVFAVGSESMSPSINKGDAIIVEKLSENEINKLKINDILVYTRGDKIIVHRIVKIERGLFNTKGDYNNSPDNYMVKKSDIIGISKIRIHYVGWSVIKLSELLNK
jgi:signal peptidase